MTTPITDEALAEIKAGLEGGASTMLMPSLATVASMIARIEAAEARVKALEEALVSIHNYHIPDMPAYYHGDELNWAQRQHGVLRLRARAALEGG